MTEALPLVSLTFGGIRGATIRTKVVVSLHVVAFVVGKRCTDICNLYGIMQNTEGRIGQIYTTQNDPWEWWYAVFVKSENLAGSRSRSLSNQSCQVTKMRLGWSIILRWWWLDDWFAWRENYTKFYVFLWKISSIYLRGNKLSGGVWFSGERTPFLRVSALHIFVSQPAARPERSLDLITRFARQKRKKQQE